MSATDSTNAPSIHAPSINAPSINAPSINAPSINATLALVLASGSPRRKELLERVGLSFTVRTADIDESVGEGEGPLECVRRLAEERAKTVFADDRFRDGKSLVLAADTIVWLADQILGKPTSRSDASAMLESLHGTTHRVTTAFSIIAPSSSPGGTGRTFSVTTEVTMRELSDDEIAGYLECGEWRGKAGGYAIQGVAAAFVAKVSGSVTNVIGLPLAEALAAIEAFGGPVARFADGAAV